MQKSIAIGLEIGVALALIALLSSPVFRGRILLSSLLVAAAVAVAAIGAILWFQTRRAGRR